MTEQRAAYEGHTPAQHAQFGALGQVCRLGLASRGNTHLDARSVERAIQQGINYLNWCGHSDGLSRAIANLGRQRDQVRVAVQLEARTAVDAERELQRYFSELSTDYLDVVTYYYVEDAAQWQSILAPGGAAEALVRHRAAGSVRAIGVTSHQRRLAAQMALSGQVDMLMIRYNAAHRGAEEQIFPLCQERKLPVVTFTGLRWGALVSPTPDDPPGFRPPSAQDCYRFVLCHPAVTVALMAPDNAAELDANLTLLDPWRGLSGGDYQAIREHGDRVRQHAGQFP